MTNLLKKMPKSSAERAREYRERCKALGLEPSSGKSKPGRSGTRGSSGTYQSRFDRAEFIAIDGEGENYGPEETFTIGDVSDAKKRSYSARDHKYTLLAASTGDELYDGGRRLGAGACFDFLLELAQKYRRAIFVIFSGSYDINHMLMHDISRDDLLRISRGEVVDVEIEKPDCFETYRVEYRPRKSLSIKAGLSFYKDKHDNIRSKYARSIVLWDVFGFFQENFVAVMQKWLGKSHPDFAQIQYMKSLRGNFDRLSDKDIQEYNRAELRCLVELMQKVAGAIRNLGLQCSRWDGAGAVAAAIFKREKVKEYKREVNDDNLNLAIRTAYSGGRIENCKIGAEDRPIFHYDINSAYPSVMRNLPCLACGTWRHITDLAEIQRDAFAIYHLKYEWPDDLPFYPLFFRQDDMSIMYPADGEGWYWTPEALGANEYAYKFGGKLEVIEAWVYETPCNHKPFGWIPEYYDKRQQWIQHPEFEWQNGGEKIIKLGLNSLYGKTAQQLGGTAEKLPTYFQMEWAGFITSGTRSALLMAALQSPWDIIAFATDGLFSLKSLDLPTPAKKELGAWEFKKHDGMVMVMPGVYWLKDGDRYQHYSRGFDKDQMETPQLVLDAWKRGERSVAMITRRLIGLGSACLSDTLWKMRGRFATGERILRLDMSNSQKRQAIDVVKEKPHLRLVDTKPRYNLDHSISKVYPLKWIEAETDADYEDEKETEKEILDSFNV